MYLYRTKCMYRKEKVTIKLISINLRINSETIFLSNENGVNGKKIRQLVVNELAERYSDIKHSYIRKPCTRNNARHSTMIVLIRIQFLFFFLFLLSLKR